LPAGGIDKGLTPEQAAAKELREETGYEGESIEIVESYYEYASKLPHITHIARIRNAKKTHEIEHETLESISTPVLLNFNREVIDQFKTSVCAAALYRTLGT
jgi:ADP-ribose pyrophosphatase